MTGGQLKVGLPLGTPWQFIWEVNGQPFARPLVPGEKPAAADSQGDCMGPKAGFDVSERRNISSLVGNRATIFRLSTVVVTMHRGS